MKRADINDLHKEGEDLQGLVEAAATADPILPRDLGKMVEAGVATLMALTEAVLAAQDGKAASKLIADHMVDEVALRATAAAFHLRSSQVLAQLTAMKQGPRGTSSAVDNLSSAVKAEARKIGELEAAREQSRSSALLDRMLSSLEVKGLRAPPGWGLSEDGVVDLKNNVVAHAPLVILGRTRDVDSGREGFTLGWRRKGGAWTQHHVPREDALNHKQLPALAGLGAPIGSPTAMAVANYLMQFESINEEALVQHTASTHMGWVNDETFLWGRQAIGDEVILAEDAGDRKTIVGYHAAGTWEGWKAGIELYVKGLPLVLAGLYASCASPFINILQQPGFIFEWSGLTSTGKTTAMRVAASPWGLPEDRGNGVIKKWNSAGLTAFLHNAWLLQSIPLLLDETKEGNPEDMKKIVYMQTSGADRQRGTPSGRVRETRTWASVLLSTGEAPITSFSSDQGARARCLCLNGFPLGALSERQGQELSTNIRRTMLEHYGHLGPRLIRWLLDHRSEWSDLRNDYRKLVHGYSAKVDTAIAKRLMESVAMLHLVGNILHSELGVPGDFGPTMIQLVEVVQGVQYEADLPLVAADALYAFASANQERFWRRVSSDREPQGGWYGRWDKGDKWNEIGFDPQLVERLLSTWGYRVPDILNAWTKRGLRRVNPKGGNPNYGRESSRLLVMKRSAFEREE